MVAKHLTDNKKAEEHSRLEAEPTYGEKVYSFVFDNLINFWVNLLFSGAFNYWAHNYTKPLKWLGNKTPFEYYEKLRHSIESGLPKNLKGTDGKPGTVAGAMANAFTLTAAGHIIMIPSVWLGAKIKAPFVRYFDRMHYGQDAEDDYRIAERHVKIDTAPRPTLFGAVLGRLGSMLATQTYAFTIGGEVNAIRWLGKKLGNQTLQKFSGLDKISESAGILVGRTTVENLPGLSDSSNKWAVKNDFGWSADQLAAGNKPPYTHFIQDMSRYVFLDVIYTAITASVIHPTIEFLRKSVPGTTYVEKLGKYMPKTRYTPKPREHVTVHIKVNGEDTTSVEVNTDEKPKTRIARVENRSTVADAPTREVGAAS